MEKVNGKELSYVEFAEKYMGRNQPVVLTGLMDDWRACRDWVTDGGKPNLQFFSTHFGTSKVQVAECGTREFTDQRRIEMTVAEFINCAQLSESTDGVQSFFYLKDWHFVKVHGLLFMLMFSDHIVGQQMFVEEKSDVNEVKFPGFKKAIWWECTQEQNEIIFVPSGWYHQVENLEDTISINHNWFNAYNLSCVWDLLLRDYLEAQECIEDLKGCDDFEELCQRNLAANTGMNIYDFFVFMVRFALSNMVQLYNLTTEDKDCSSRSFQMGRHLVLNLKCIRSIALKMKSTAMDVKHGILTDRRKELEDELFGELCTCLGKTYGLIHEQSQVDHNIDKVLFKYLESNFHLSGCPVSDSEDLATLIDNGLMKLGGCFID